MAHALLGVSSRWPVVNACGGQIRPWRHGSELQVVNTCTKGQLVVRRGQLGGEGGQKSEDQEPGKQNMGVNTVNQLAAIAAG